MDRIRKLIHEAHRRSLWQVLSVYMVGSWVALQVVESISESAGLPDWQYHKLNVMWHRHHLYSIRVCAFL